MHRYILKGGQDEGCEAAIGCNACQHSLFSWVCWVSVCLPTLKRTLPKASPVAASPLGASEKMKSIHLQCVCVCVCVCPCFVWPLSHHPGGGSMGAGELGQHCPEGGPGGAGWGPEAVARPAGGDWDSTRPGRNTTSANALQTDNTITQAAEHLC